MEKRKNLTAAYAAVQGSYWMGYCVTMGFAAVYLQGLGYINAELGIILAAGSLLGAVLGPLLSSFIDRYASFTAARLVPPLIALEAAAIGVLIAFPAKGVPTDAGFVLYIAFSIALNSVNLKLYVDISHGNGYINYGVARGMGSLAYVLISILLGSLTERMSIHILPFAGLILCALQLAAHIAVCRLSPASSSSSAEAKKGVSIPAFARANPRFCVLLLGTALMFFSHNAICNFLINVTRNSGGDTGTMGYLNGFMAAVEIPVMLLYKKLFGNKNSGGLLRFSFLFFTLKAAAIAAASTLPTLFAAFVLQAPSFALYTSAIVPYVEKNISYDDSAKAQSLAFTMTTVGSVLASVIGGRLYDAVSVTETLWIASAVSAVGTVIAIIGTQNKKTR